MSKATHTKKAITASKTAHTAKAIGVAETSSRGQQHISKADAALWMVVLDHLRDKLKRPVAAQDFVAYAEAGEGPHVDRVRSLLWFDTKGDAELALMHRIERAGYITRCAYVLVQTPKQAPLRIRGLVSVKQAADAPYPRGYISVTEVSNSATRRREVIEDAKASLLHFQRKYANLTTLFGVGGGKVLDVIAVAIKHLNSLK